MAFIDSLTCSRLLVFTHFVAFLLSQVYKRFTSISHSTCIELCQRHLDIQQTTPPIIIELDSISNKQLSFQVNLNFTDYICMEI